MVYNLLIAEDAKREIDEGYLYYEQLQEGLGEKFLSAIINRFSDLSTHPEFYSFIDSKNLLRDVAVAPFPYVIVFEIMDNDVVIFSVHLTYRQSD